MLLLSDGELINNWIASAFPELPHPRLLWLTHSMQPKSFDHQQPIPLPDNLQTAMYLFTSGPVEFVTRNGFFGKQEVRLDRGDYLALPDLQTFTDDVLGLRSATGEPVEALVLDRDSFQVWMAEDQTGQARTALVIASIAVGLFAFGVIATLYVVIRQDMRDGYAAVQPANIRLRTSLINDDMVESISKVPGVKDAQGARLISLRLQSGPDEWTTIGLNSQPDFANSSISKLSLESGTLDLSKRQILIERYKLADTNAELGDLVAIETPAGQIRHLELVGVVSDQTNGAFSGAGGFFLSPVQGYG
jgi:hypothetical protein